MYCYHCGNKLDEQAHFCDKCGMAVRRGAKGMPPFMEKERDTVKKKKSAWIVILISSAALVLLVVIAVCLIRSERGVKRTLEKYRVEYSMDWDDKEDDEDEYDEDEFWDTESGEDGIQKDDDQKVENSF